jgi:hypothetical protein
MTAVYVLLLLARVASAELAPDAAQPQGAAAIRLEDLEGRAVAPLPGPSGATTVFVFVGTECPISNRYAPELRRIHDRFASEARFWLVYADPSETPAAIRRHLEAFGYGIAALRDPRHELVRFAGVHVTPEAAVFAPGAPAPRLVYRGRIDDRNVDFGLTRPSASTHDLENALRAVASGTAGALRTTRAVGCAIPPLR